MARQPRISAETFDLTAPHTDERDVRRPLRPGEDPFHDAPPGLASLAPGTVIRTRQVRVGFLGIVPQRGLTAWQLAYRSTDLDGTPEVAVSTVLVPRGVPRRAGAGSCANRSIERFAHHFGSKTCANRSIERFGGPHGQAPPRPQGLVAYQCAIDAVSDRCFPSYALRTGARSWGALPQLELMLITGLLDRGYVVSLADHEGRHGHFAAPREPGYRVLDGIRAALAFPPLGLTGSSPVGLFGYSGGGMASAWAAEMAPTYAPEIDLVGAVLGSPVGDPGEAFLKLNGGPRAGLPALVVSGLRHAYPGLAKVVHQHASLEGIQRLDALGEMTTVGAVVRYAFDDFDDFVDPPLADVLAEPEVLAVFDDLRLGVAAPQCPLLVVQATHDQIIDVRDIDSQVERYVAQGADVTYLRDRLSEHISLMVLAMPQMLAWLDERFAARIDGPDVPLGAGTHTGTRTVFSLALAPRAWPGFVRMLGAAVRTAVGRAG